MKEIDILLKDYNGKIDTFGFNRIKSYSIIVSPTITYEHPELILLLIICYKTIYLTCPKEHYDSIINRVSVELNVEKRFLYKRIILLCEYANPIDDSDAFYNYIINSKLDEDIRTQIDISATSILCGTEEGKLANKKAEESMPGITEMLPIAGPFLNLRELWLPTSFRTRFMFEMTNKFNASYLTTDNFESEIHNSVFQYGLRDSARIQSLYKDKKLCYAIEHRIYFLEILMMKLLRFSDEQGTVKSYKSIVIGNENMLIESIDNILDTLADKLYSPPYYILDSEIDKMIDSTLSNALSSFSINHIKTFFMEALGNIPLLVPNPIAIYNSCKNYIEKRQIAKDVGWLIYLTNLQKMKASFSYNSSLPIIDLSITKLSDEIVYTNGRTYVVNKNSGIVHKNNCIHVQSLKCENAQIVLDGMGNFFYHSKYEPCMECKNSCKDF